MLRKRLVLRGMLADVSCDLMCTDISAALGDIEGVVILMQAELARRKTAIARVKVTALYCGVQGFMQDTIIASHTCFGGHMDVNCLASLRTFRCA